MTLANLQRAFQQYVLSDDDAVASHIHASEEITAAARLNVYGDAYRLRLADALAANYPRLQRLLGDEDFAVLAREYLARHPSSNPSVRWFGDRLADHLRDQPSFTTSPWLSELARWEWAIAAAFDAPDHAPIDAGALAAVEAAHWPALQFTFHPSAQCLALSTNAPALFKALSEGGELPAPASIEPRDWLIWRPGLTPRYRSLPHDESAALRRAMAGGTFSDLCEILCDWHEPADVAVAAVRLLQQWIAEALIVGASVAE
jgi:hypothetical protein